ncbi:unnamed protein product [Arctia plantaginis]|uniref:Uncharacterized protein n=1 Tax=Arctia plantaginis TaxID=874455 RepID=A0A8S1AFU3_ARCPL|nr:unnamed protein product [Arctia plantaginis]
MGKISSCSGNQITGTQSAGHLWREIRPLLDIGLPTTGSILPRSNGDIDQVVGLICLPIILTIYKDNN